MGEYRTEEDEGKKVNEKKTYEHLLASLHGYLSFTHFLSSTCILLKDLPNLTLAALLIRPSNPIHVVAVEV